MVINAEISIHIQLARYDVDEIQLYMGNLISIHILLERYDPMAIRFRTRMHISIHIPLARYDVRGLRYGIWLYKFQSTYRSRGMTQLASAWSDTHVISIHIPLARYDDMQNEIDAWIRISIHIPLARYDLLFAVIILGVCNDFNPHTARAV